MASAVPPSNLPRPRARPDTATACAFRFSGGCTRHAFCGIDVFFCMAYDACRVVFCFLVCLPMADNPDFSPGRLRFVSGQKGRTRGRKTP